MSDRWIIIPNWEKYNPRADRALPWFKVYYHLTRRDDFRQLSLGDRGLLVSIWCEYGPSKGQLRVVDVGNRVGLTPHYAHISRHLKALSDAGFIVLSATRPPELANVLEEKRKEKTPKPPAAKPRKKPQITGWRLVRGSHGVTHVPDPEGTDRL